MAIDRDALRDYLRTDLHVDLSEVDDQSPLFTSGIVDSFAIVELMLFLEQQLGAKLDPEDITLENLDTVEKILAFTAARA